MKEKKEKHHLLNRNFVNENPGAFALVNAALDLPEKVIQFGTGVLLRGLVDYIIDRANKALIFNGSVVIVKSTDGPVCDFVQQDNLYTVLEKGLLLNNLTDQKHLITCISRVLTAGNDWEAILQCASNPLIEIVISNTTEAGLVFVNETLGNEIPQSFPAKLTAYLWHRYQTFNGDKNKGMVILPTELRSYNGRLLKEFVLQHAHDNKLPPEFSAWILNSNRFCNTLVDRIVPGKTEKDDLVVWNDKVSYFDHLHAKTEPFLLWAIEGDSAIAEKLTFTQIDDRVIITNDIEKYEEQKLRILNGSNSIVVSPAFLAGCDTLLDTIQDNLFAEFTRRLIDTEIIPTIIDRCPDAGIFAREVLDRFGNPSVLYRLLNIAFQCSSKINSRNAATIVKYYQAFNRYPPLTLIGLASFFLFYTPKGKDESAFYGLRNGAPYFFRDDHAEFLCGTLENIDWRDSEQAENTVAKIFENNRIFSPELASLPRLSKTIVEYCALLEKDGIRETIRNYLNIK